MGKRGYLPFIVLIMVFAACAHKPSFEVKSQPDISQVVINAETESGTVAGYRMESEINAFLGIPYAKSPVGVLRFAPPREIGKWDGIRPANEFGASCPQIIDEYEPASLYKQSEDCLSLNIWTPGADDKKRPVIIYIHGGGFVNGGTADPLYNGSYISKRGDIVFASVNYRVNALGYLYLEDFGAQYKGSSNLAIQDQLMGIRWIKNNIANFGGDPDNITIMGESAGSASVMILMGLPQAKGLFTKAIAESGGCNLVRTREQASRYTKQFLKAAGVKDIESLRKLSADDIVKAVNKQLNEAGFEADLVFAPVVDGDIIPVDPLKSIDNGSAKEIAFLNGTNLDEYRYWINYSGILRFIPMGVMLDAVPDVKARLGGKDKELIEFYKKKNPHSGISDNMFEFATDMMFLIPHIQATEAQSKYANVWMYRFDWKSQAKDYFGACHAIELPFVLKTFDSPTRWQIVGPNPPMDLSDTIMDAWVAFARTGNPNHAGMKTWPQYEAGQRATMIFNTESEVINDPEKDVRLIYKGITY